MPVLRDPIYCQSEEIREIEFVSYNFGLLSSAFAVVMFLSLFLCGFNFGILALSVVSGLAGYVGLLPLINAYQMDVKEFGVKEAGLRNAERIHRPIALNQARRVEEVKKINEEIDANNAVVREEKRLAQAYKAATKINKREF